MKNLTGVILFFFFFNLLQGQTTYYSYQSGNWSSNTTWTTDPSGTTWVNGNIPGAIDNIVILNGRTVKINENTKQVASLTISYGGVIDLQSTTSHNFGTVSGQGLLRSRSTGFPGGNFAGFVSASGGTIEFYNFSGTLPMPSSPANTFNNLMLTKDDASASTYLMVLSNDLTVNSDLTLSNTSGLGTNALNIGNNTTARTITINGNLKNYTGCSVGVSAFNAVHSLYIYGDLVNTGKVDLNNNSANANNSQGAARITFKGAANNTVSINANTAFYDFSVDKGVDQSPVLEVVSDAPVSPFEGYSSPKYSINLISGTLKLSTNINVPKVMVPGGNFDISTNADNKAGLWVASNATMTFQNPVVVYGKLHVSESAYLNGGPVIVTRESGEIQIEGGTVTVNQFRPSTVTTATPRGSFTMTNGTFNVTGPEHASGFAIFDWPYSNTSFKMSGGAINIASANATGSLRLGSNNYDVTGGTINIIIPTTNNAVIQSSVPLWNVNISKATASAMVAKFSTYPFQVLNNLIVQTGNNATLDANNLDLFVGGNFYLQSGTNYIPGVNTTTFNGTAGQVFDNLGNITGGLNNCLISNKSNLSVTKDLVISNNLTLNSNCFINDNGKTIQVTGSVYNSGTAISQANGGILLNGTTNQVLGGSGSGIFGNLFINKVSGSATLSANQTVVGNLRLAGGVLDLATYNLQLGSFAHVYDALTGSGTSFDAAKMFRTSGNPSDGGLSKVYNATGSFLFPIGTNSNYTPEIVQFNSAPSVWGMVSVKPVGQYNPLVTSTNSLNYYWKITSSGFSGLTSGSVTQIFHYEDAFLTGRGSEASYVPGVYRPNAWTVINDISKVVDNSNDIYFNDLELIDGEYTAGELNAFQPVKVFYSRQTGDWNDYLTWSNDSVGGNAVADPAPGVPVVGIHIPGPNNPVVIGNGVSKNHTVTIPASYSGAVVGNLQINQNSILDITTSTGHNFGYIPDTKISGTGKLRISSNNAVASFPGGDFGNFLSSAGGTIEYYTTGTTNFVLPGNASTSTYSNLILSPSTGRTITMPSRDITVFGNFETDGTGVSQLNSTSSKTLTIQKNLTAKQGTLRFMNNNQPQSLVVEGDIFINNGASFDVSTATNAVNLLTLKGNLTNNGTFDMYGNSANAVCDVTFTGDANKVIAGNATLTEFDYLTVDKGTSTDPLLNATIDKLSLSGSGNALRLNNGTFRISNAALSFTLSTTNTFTIPKTGSLSVSYGTANIGTSSDNGDLILVGRLEVINAGIVNIGNGGNYNNDIEYSPNGIPEIVVRDNGVLNVNGQIRRGNSVTGGSLSYTQSGGAVKISGNNQINSRGKFEVLNAGSQFNISGGDITIVNGGGDAGWFGDILLVPETSNVTGGSLQIGNTSTTNTSFLMNIACPVWNLVLDGTTTSKTANVRVNPLTIKNDLIINNNSEFHANGWNIFIGRNLANSNSGSSTGIASGGFQAGNLSQTTTFNSSSGQTISGVSGNLTNFANLVISSGGTVNLTSNTQILVNKNLNLTSGTFSDAGNTVTILGNIDNSATHFSSGITGGLIFSGSSSQIISGNGSGKFGNVTLNNSNNVNMADDSEIDGLLTFTLGSLYIDDYLLTLGETAAIGGSVNSSKMIRLNGALSDRGVRKYYPATSADFTFPIGVTGKYTPARFKVNTFSSAGYIQVSPVNSRHSNLQDASGNELSYYWSVSSNGLNSANVQHLYSYMPSDISGTEGNYVTGRYYQGNWTPVGGITGSVNTSTHQINLLTASGVDYIDGEYTAGENTNFFSVPVFYNRISGNWEDPATWSTDPVLKFSGAPASITPNGNPVYLAPGNTVTITGNSKAAYSVNIPETSTLDIKNTVFHNLGHLSGGGILTLTSTDDGMFVMPGGEYDSLMKSSTTTIIFNNPNTATPATLPLKPGNVYKPFQNVVFIGSGTKLISAEHLKILGDLTINGGTLSNSLYNKNIYIHGNWIDNVSTSSLSSFVPGSGWVIFEGTNSQNIVVTSAGATGNFYNFRINNPQGLTLSGAGKVAVSNLLQLQSGLIVTNATNSLTLTNVSPSVVIGGGLSSFIKGPLRKNISNGSYFNFPVGKDARYGNIYVNSVVPSGIVEAEFYNSNPGISGMAVSNKVLPIDTVTVSKYWRINTSSSTQGNVRISWDATDIASGFIPASLSARNKLRIVRWNGSAWQNEGNLIKDADKTIQTSTPIIMNGNNYFGLGIESLPTATLTAGSVSICNDGASASLQIDLTGNPPWAIKYKVNGANETTISNIASTPYFLVVSNATVPLNSGAGNYTFTLSQVTDATGATGIKDFTNSYKVTLYESPSPVISGNKTVPGGQVAIYSTPNVAGHTYVWTVVGQTSFTGQNTNQITVTWGAGPVGSVQVKETITVGGCNKTTALYSVSITDIPNPLISGNNVACAGATESYSTPDVSTHGYSWTVTGGNIISGQNTHSISVEWTTSGSGSVRVYETGSETKFNTLDVTVNPIPASDNNVVYPTICSGETAYILIESAAAGITYQLRLDSNNSAVGLPISSGPGGNVTLSAVPSASYFYNIKASNEYNCEVQLAKRGAIIVKPVPSTGAMYRKPND
jgi:hypothetical protein